MMNRKEFYAAQKNDDQRNGLKPLEDDDLDQVSGGTGNPDEPYQGSSTYETGGFAL